MRAGGTRGGGRGPRTVMAHLRRPPAFFQSRTTGDRVVLRRPGTLGGGRGGLPASTATLRDARQPPVSGGTRPRGSPPGRPRRAVESSAPRSPRPGSGARPRSGHIPGPRWRTPGGGAGPRATVLASARRRPRTRRAAGALPGRRREEGESSPAGLASSGAPRQRREMARHAHRSGREPPRGEAVPAPGRASAMPRGSRSSRGRASCIQVGRLR